MLLSETSFIVKVCGITNEDDAEASLEAGANAIGFNFYSGSRRYVTAQRARQIVRSVPGRYLKVGVFVDASDEELLETASSVPLDVLQVHGHNHCAQLASSFRTWQAASPLIDHASLDTNVEAWLLDTPSPNHGGSGITFDWSLAKTFPRRAVIAGGLDGSNVAEAIRTARPWGVDACSRLEADPGRKNTALIKAFVENALAAFRVAQGVAS
jgi:phosphoribosylanthranilate isomerase